MIKCVGNQGVVFDGLISHAERERAMRACMRAYIKLRNTRERNTWVVLGVEWGREEGLSSIVTLGTTNRIDIFYFLFFLDRDYCAISHLQTLYARRQFYIQFIFNIHLDECIRMSGVKGLTKLIKSSQYIFVHFSIKLKMLKFIHNYKFIFT